MVFKLKDPNKQIVMLYNEYFVIQSMSSQTSYIYIDDEISKRQNSITRFQFEFDYLQNIENVKIIEPESNHTYSLYETDNCEQKFLSIGGKLTGEIICNFDGPVTGKWAVLLTNPYYDALTVHLTVTSYIRQNHRNDKHSNNPIIKVDAAWHKPIIYYPNPQALYVSVSRALRPVLNAQVQALVMSPNGEALILELHDDGLFSDHARNDGIYSCYFTNYTSDGPYNAHVIIIKLKIKYFHLFFFNQF